MATALSCLHIDDNENDRELFCRALRNCDHSYECVTCSNCMEALVYLEQAASLPDFVFLDLNMALMGGIHCLRLLKNHPRFTSIPVIVLSGAAEPASIEEMQRSGASHFIAKPTRLQTLTTMLNEVFVSAPLPFFISEQDRESSVL